MGETIVNINKMPDFLYGRFNSKKVRVFESPGVIIIVPFEEKQANFSRLPGMFADGRLSTEKYCMQKQLDLELEQ